MTDALDIPRAGSCRSSDPDYDPVLVRIGRRIVIEVDGVAVDHVIAYDCDEGRVRQLRCNGHGKPYVESGKAAEQTLRGSVSVRWR